MSRKMIIGLVGLVLVLAVGYGIYYASIRQPQVATQKSGGKGSSEPLAKLVYVGTNETLSEALYHLDLQDGKLKRPYIVHKILKEDSESDPGLQSLTFIGKDGKIKKVRKFKSIPSKVDILITPKGENALVYSDYDGWALATVRYYDVEGNLLWKKKDTFNWYTFSPDGKILTEKIPQRDSQTYNLIDAKGRILKKDFFSIDISKIEDIYYPSNPVKFSENAKFFVLEYGFQNSSQNYIFDKNANLIYEKNLGGFSRVSRGVFLSDFGHYYLLGYEPSSAKQTFFIFNEKGKQIYKRIQTYDTRINDFAVLDDFRVYIVTRNKTLRLINVKTSEEMEIYEGGSLNRVKLCSKMPVISDATKINSEKAMWKVLVIKEKKPHMIFECIIPGLNPNLYEISDFICVHDLLILIKGAYYYGDDDMEVKRIYRIKR